MDPLIIFLYLVVFACLVWGGFWIIGQMGLVEPIGMFARIAFGIFCLIILVTVMTGSIPLPSFRLPGR